MTWDLCWRQCLCLCTAGKAGQGLQASAWSIQAAQVLKNEGIEAVYSWGSQEFSSPNYFKDLQGISK